jgi:Caspase domain
MGRDGPQFSPLIPVSSGSYLKSHPSSSDPYARLNALVAEPRTTDSEPRGMKLTLLITLSLVVVAGTALGAPERRIALVVGNDDYQAVPRLANPANDARLVASTLKKLDFQFVGGGPLLDVDKPRFDQAVQKFGEAAEGAAIAFFYYATRIPICSTG